MGEILNPHISVYKLFHSGYVLMKFVIFFLLSGLIMDTCETCFDAVINPVNGIRQKSIMDPSPQVFYPKTTSKEESFRGFPPLFRLLKFTFSAFTTSVSLKSSQNIILHFLDVCKPFLSFICHIYMPRQVEPTIVSLGEKKLQILGT